MTHMRTITFLLTACCLVSAGYSQGNLVTITVSNPSSVARSLEPVVVRWATIPPPIHQADRDQLRLLDEHGRSLAFQIDDLDANGRPDELVFVTDLQPKGTRVFVLTDTASSLASPAGPLRTDAGNWKRVDGKRIPADDDDGSGLLRSQSSYVFDGAGWESDVIGYRIYLDERNAFDVQARRHPGLHWNFIGSTGVDYQLDAYWGMDVLHVGPALGVGGFGFWVSDSIVKPFPLERRRTRILARGPVRSLVRIDYSGWQVGEERVDMTLLCTIYAGTRESVQEIILSRAASPKTIAVGIVKHPQGAPVWNSEKGYLYTLGRQSRVNDSLLLALTIPAGRSARNLTGPHDHLILLDLKKDAPLSYGIVSLWEGEAGGMWTQQEIEQFLSAKSLKFSQPLQVRLGKE